MKKTGLLFFIAFLVSTSYSQGVAEAAIKRLLEKESATWRSGDIQEHAACWAIQPYSRIVVSAADGTVIDIDPELIIRPPADMVGKGGTSVNSNYKIHVNGKNAWVSHDEVSTTKDGKKSYSYEFRILEKIRGEWKLVGQSIHMYKQK